MNVTVHLFAAAREAAGSEGCHLVLPEPASGLHVRAALAERFPRLAAVLTSARLAVNEEYRAWDAPLADADVLAVIPPVSGG